MNRHDTDQESTCVRAMSDDEMAEAEHNAARAVDAWMLFFRQFPTATNFDGVLDRMRDYQAAWMNGRKRVKVL